MRRQAESSAEQHEKLAALIEFVAGGDDDLSVYGLLALEWGLRFSAMQHEWAEWAEGEIERVSGADAPPAAR
ncbi:hypothetical protein [Streptosporangium lutulentum]|uniref:Transcription regulator PadR C-terminal domain-containing protein n=1 Tax=Streptosporangium lutulentum TaxID=1461250 RepID=A0ABT9QK55_9ACTN|nr:hypothetical protein [Streptosporangium lutulentum]MDP9846663.1 hypothetical protein [Streptosporangium lutulentum]